jgi:hypothetical protein
MLCGTLVLKRALVLEWATEQHPGGFELLAWAGKAAAPCSHVVGMLCFV